MEKIVTLPEAVSRVRDGQTIAFGGNVLHRSPMAAVLELVRQGQKNLHLVKTAIALEVDLLCASGQVDTVTAGYVGYETEFGLCAFYRRAVESGRTRANENACYTVITSFRAAIQGVPFLPVRGLQGSDLVEAVDFRPVTCPYTGEQLYACRAIQPDVAFVHVQQADRQGNARISGPHYEDLLIARAAKTVILSAEEIVDDDFFASDPHQCDIPGLLVDAVVHMPGGAAPGTCSGHYGLDREVLRSFKAAKTPAEALAVFGLQEVVS